MAECDHDEDGHGGVRVDEAFSATGEIFEQEVDESSGGDGEEEHDEDAAAEENGSPDDSGEECELDGEVEFAARDGPDEERGVSAVGWERFYFGEGGGDHRVLASDAEAWAASTQARRRRIWGVRGRRVGQT